MPIELNSFRAAAGMAVSEYYAQHADDSSKVSLAGANSNENLAIRRSLVEALSAESGVPKSYLDVVRERLGLKSTSESELAGCPLDSREVKEIIETADKLCLSNRMAVMVTMEKIIDLTSKAGVELLDQAVEDELNAALDELESLGVEGDDLRVAQFNAFREEAKARMREMAATMKKSVEGAGPEDCERIQSAIDEYMTKLRDVLSIARRAASDLAFDYTAIKWPQPMKPIVIMDPGSAKISRLRSAERERRKAEANRRMDDLNGRISELEAQMVSLLAQLRAKVNSRKGGKDDENHGSSVAELGIVLMKETNKFIEEMKRLVQRQEFEALISGFRQRLAERLGVTESAVMAK